MRLSYEKSLDMDPTHGTNEKKTLTHLSDHPHEALYMFLN